MIILENKTSSATIDNGELISFKMNAVEYIHQKGSKGWRKSDDEMFPIIGPTSKNNFVVHTKKGDGIQDQHGLLRELPYSLISSDASSALFSKTYLKNTPVKNSKFPEKSTAEYLTWPFDFIFEKKFVLEDGLLIINFTIKSEKNMPFMLGYHPAFLLSNFGKETFVANGVTHTLEDVYKAGSNAFPILNTNTILLKNIEKNNIQISTTGFNNFMLWTEVNNMVCIEPITQYTSYTNQKFSEENMSLSSGKNTFSVALKVL